MSFVVWAALAIAGLVIGPIVAHLLHLGRAREREFPPAALVPTHRSTARERSRLEDFPLLVLRSALIVGLAVLGATPLVRCDRLALGRTSGASVALAIVLDDSASMRASLESGKTRWDVAKTGAEQLLHSAREGDAIAIVLAGRPSRIALAPTTDLGAAERALSELAVSDRSTDLRASVELARAALKPLPQRDHRLVVLSDLADDEIGEGTPPASVPLTELSAKVNDCAITSVERRGPRVTAAVACSSDSAAQGRSLELVVVSEASHAAHAADAGARHVAAGDVAAHAELSPRRGEQSLSLSVPRGAGTLNARLTGADACRHDDEAPVSEESTASVVGVVADPTRAAAKTGGPTVVEQALQALGDSWVVRPLPFVPDDEKGLDGTSALVIDDPPGFSPEARASLAGFLSRGGVAAALLGPRSAATALGWTLEPFGRGAARWEEAKDLQVDTGSLSWLGPEATSLGTIARRGRTRLDGMEISGARVNGRWKDGVPFLLERAAGRGLAVTVGLPASLDESDFALRPGFIALLDHLLRQASQREGGRRTTAGGAWTFPSAKQVSVEGPEGRTPVTQEPSDEACAERGAPPGCGDTVLRAVASDLGRYTVHVDGATETRIATLDPAEILAEPRSPPKDSQADSVRGSARVGVSRELSFVLVALFAAELAVRLFRKWTGRRTVSPRSVIPNP
ncbi:MAG TPA: BatA and WFA domain-containing protein [Polyangiaceae bacterium]|nr:BatA and WFA domain-containing protein [Polyangiaceae bacterium]